MSVQTFQLHVPSLACAACVNSLSAALLARDPQAQVSGDPDRKQLTVASQLSEAEVRATIQAAGHLLAEP